MSADETTDTPDWY